MDYLEIEYRKNTQTFNMPYMQFHDYYEFYFLLNGSREVFFENNLFVLHSGCLCIIPPYSMHKTEGAAYERINLYISKSLLSPDELAFLQQSSEHPVYQLTLNQMQFVKTLLKEASTIQITDSNKRRNLLLSFSKAFLAYLQVGILQPVTSVSSSSYSKHPDSIILQIAAFLGSEYRRHLTLDYLHKKFYLSKNTLCKRFREQMNCSPIEYLTYIRVNKAKMYLSTTKKSVSEIAELCGFSSANYFGLIFKKQIGLSPLNYRKRQ